ncbi:DUF421 domain-containing protein [Spirosoma sp. KCTC 42546]|uniref:DUF421 domain-containing protein n=1 Tax=Spirosoma sp. KCTC 42546 TaxID=2520506 RepID=UPI00115787AD|nr:YetF domain-containing protein [Spirosoma sp. KCTC 42546]QDK80211.1 DUF421 domain-containing protein [Spirosoma sp. KCTC 42546]
MTALLLVDIDWGKMVTPSMSLWEILIRGTLTYWFCFAYIRFFRRGAGQLGISDLLLITLISDASQNSMAGEYTSITEGFVLVGVLVFWDYAINWLGYRSVFFSKIGEPDPVLLIKNGVMQRQNMKKELITASELTGMLREQGVDDLVQVRACYIEGSGNISIIKK